MITAGAASYVGPAVAGSDDAGPTIVVESAGDPATAVLLPPVAVVGQSASSSAILDISATVLGQSFDLGLQLDLMSTISAVPAEGGYVTNTTIDRLELTEAPAGMDASALGYDDLVGVQFEQTFDASGQIVSTELLNAEQLSAEAQAAATEFTSNLQTAQFAYPDVPVGIGAAWTAELEVVSEGLVLPVAYRFQLTDVANGRYTLALTWSSDFDTGVQGAEMTGAISGTGTLTGSVDNVLDVTATVDQTLDANIAGQGDMTIVIGVDTKSSPG